MAAANEPPTYSTIFADISSNYLECNICMEQFDQPKFLPCTHTFCIKCIEQYIAKKGDPFPCPTCRNSTKVPQDGFPNNTFVIGLQDTLGAISHSHRKCQFCVEEGKTTVTAEFRCLDCKDYLCKGCKEVHCLSRMTRSHKIYSMEELKEPTIQEELRCMQEVFCTVHPGEPVKFFCKPCQVNVCLHCTVLTHHGHKCDTLKDAADCCKRDLRQQLEEAKEQVQIYKNAVAEVNGQVRLTGEQLFNTEVQIEAWARKLQMQISCKKEEMLSSVRNQQSLLVKRSDALIDEVEFDQGVVQSLCDTISHLANHGKDAEILQIHTSLSSRVQQLKQVKSTKDLACVEFTLSVNDEIKTILTKKEKNLIVPISPPNRTVSYRYSQKQFSVGEKELHSNTTRNVKQWPYDDVFETSSMFDNTDRIQRRDKREYATKDATLYNNSASHRVHRQEKGKKAYLYALSHEQVKYPQYWTKFKSNKNFLLGFVDAILYSDYCHADVDKKMFEAIEYTMHRTWRRDLIGHGCDAFGLTHKSIKIQKIERIENPELYMAYAEKRQKMFCIAAEGHIHPIDKHPTCPVPPVKTKGSPELDALLFHQVNEYFLFHGTKADTINIICKQGPDNRMGNDQAMFGSGTCVFESSTKADEYVDDKANRVKGPHKILILRMLLGNAFICSKADEETKFKRPPCSTCNKLGCRKHPGTYDSVVSSTHNNFREFTVYSREQSYPEFVVTYDRV